MNKISLIRLFLGIIIIVLIIFIVYYILTIPSRRETTLQETNFVLDSNDNFHFFWTRSYWEEFSKGEQKDLYYQKSDLKGNILIGPMKLRDDMKFLWHVIDSEDNLHVFVESLSPGYHLKYLKVDDGTVVAERGIIDKSSIDRRTIGNIYTVPKENPLRVGIDREDNIYLIYSTEKRIVKEKSHHIGYSEVQGTNTYFEKWNRNGETIIDRTEVDFVSSRRKRFSNILINGKKLRIDGFEVGMSDYFKPLYLIHDGVYHEAALNSLEYSLSESAEKTKNFYVFTTEGDAHSVLLEDPPFLGYEHKPCGYRSKSCTVMCYKLDNISNVVKKNEIIKFKDTIISTPSIHGIRTQKDQNGDIIVAYYVNYGRNIFTTYYSKVDLGCNVLEKRIKMK